MVESPKFLHINKEITVEEHEGDVRFLTGSRNIGISCIRNEKYAIWSLVMAESPKLLHSSAMDLRTRLRGRYHVPRNVFPVSYSSNCCPDDILGTKAKATTEGMLETLCRVYVLFGVCLLIMRPSETLSLAKPQKVGANRHFQSNHKIRGY